MTMLARLIPALLVPALAALAGGAAGAERINHDGRILGTQPTVSAPILFNTGAADAVVSAMQIMPRDSAWNEDITGRPVAANSGAMIANIRADVVNANRQRLVVFKEMNYVLVPDTQPKIDIAFFNYASESDDLDPGNANWGLWPVPSVMPVETWPSEQPGLSNAQWQQDINGDGGDRHSIIVMPGVGSIWETWTTQLTTLTPAWQASNGAKFSLVANTARPAGWTSGDAAGLPMFPALVRYDEAERGMIEHAMRIVVKRSRQAYIYPASHQAGSTSLVDVPAMGQRLRLKSSFAIPASWTKEETAIALGLKKYGAIVADNGSFFSISACPDDRWPANCFDHLATGALSGFCDINNFEVIDATAANAGPRSAGAPTADAGADQTVTLAAGASLAGTVTGSGLTTLWYVYPFTTQPGTMSFGGASSTSTTATFSAAGTYTVMLKASDGVHCPAFDAVVITVQSGGAGNPAPSLASINPGTAVQNSGSFTLTLTGSGFIAGSLVSWSGQTNLPAVTATATQLTVTVPAAYLSSPGSPSLAVVIAAPGGGTSATRTFTIIADTTPPVASAIASSGVTSSGATIAWTTNEGSDTQVDFGLSTTYGSSTALAAGMVTSHSRTLGGLAAGTLYHYRVRSRDAAGNLLISGDSTFTTAAAGTGTSTGTGTTSAGGTGTGSGSSGASGTGGSGKSNCGVGVAASLGLALAGIGYRRRSRD